jgi:hypothetical protein
MMGSAVDPAESRGVLGTRYWGSHGGYQIIDNRASPGVSEEFVPNGGVPDAAFAPEGKAFEADTYNCAHCGFVVRKNPMRKRPWNKCRNCDRDICDKPECNAGCLPVAKVFDVAETQAHEDIGVDVNRVQQSIDRSLEQVKVRDLSAGDFVVYPDRRKDEITALTDSLISRHVIIVLNSGNQSCCEVDSAFISRCGKLTAPGMWPAA